MVLLALTFTLIMLSPIIIILVKEFKELKNDKTIEL